LKKISSVTPGVVGENVKRATTCGDVDDTVSVLELVAVWPVSLVTLRTIVYVPEGEYWCVVEAPVPVVPSPNSQANRTPAALVVVEKTTT